MSNIVSAFMVSALENEQLIGLHADPDDLSTFSVGWVMDVSEDQYALWSIGEDGTTESQMIGKIDQVLRVTVPGAPGGYLENLRLVAEAPDKSQFIKADFLGALDAAITAGSIVTLLDFARLAYTGLILELNEGAEYLRIRAMKANGTYEDDEIIPLNDVLRLEINGPVERAAAEALRRLAQTKFPR